MCINMQLLNKYYFDITVVRFKYKINNLGESYDHNQI